MSTDNIAATYIASISAFVGLCSAFLAFLSYRKSVKHYDLNKRDLSFSNWRKNLDDCYTELSDFVNNYSKADELEEKRIARDKILYLLEIYRPDINKSEYIDSRFKDGYGDIGIKISDITYECDFEKINRDLGIIKNSIFQLKSFLIEVQDKRM